MTMSKFSGMALEVEKPQRMVLMHPVTNQPLRDEAGREACIDLYSADSQAALRHNRAVQRRHLNARGRVKLTPEELEANRVEFLAALTVGWHLVDLAGKHVAVDCNTENARDLYSNPALSWVRDQVDEFTGDRGNFSPALSSSSTNTQSTISDKAEG
jgi:hypothetical protein